MRCLGAEFIGLTGALGNILGYLNLAELGVGGAISFFLFKLLQSHDREKINEIISDGVGNVRKKCLYLRQERTVNMSDKIFPIGIQNFERLRKEGCFYVDKTALIYKMVKSGSFFSSKVRDMGKWLVRR